MLKLQRIAQNLLTNALQATQRGGIVVRCSLEDGSRTEHWTLSIEDTGPGFTLQAAGELRHALKRATEEAHKTERHRARDSPRLRDHLPGHFSGSLFLRSRPRAGIKPGPGVARAP